MLSQFAPLTIILLLVASACVLLLRGDATARRLRERIAGVRVGNDGQTLPAPLRVLKIRSASGRRKRVSRVMRLLQLNPEIEQQNVIPWKLVIVMACAAGLVGFFYGRPFLGGPVAALAMPVEALLVARVIFGWERARYQRALLEQIPDVMALICHAIGAGVPLTEALRSVAREATSPSREEFANVVSDVAIGHPLERALWKLHERVGLPEYAFFAVTIGLQAQTGGSLVEILESLQDMVRKRVALSRRGKAMAAEARMSATILGGLPVAISLVLYLVRPGYLDFFVNDRTGTRLLLVACGLLGSGIMVMRQLIRRSLAP
jgi:tight adherence protein B